MKKKITIIKMGRTLPDLKKGRGDFHDWIIDGLNAATENVEIVSVFRGEKLPKASRCSGIIVTGSHDMVTDHFEWSERTALWIKEVIAARIPFLGICYGHQLLAYAMGGKIGANLAGPKFGSIEVRLKETTVAEGLFKGFPQRFYANVGHSQSVLKLPEGAMRLGSASHDPNHVFSFGDTAWGLQFHPEFDREITKAYITQYTPKLMTEGVNPADAINSLTNTPYAGKLLSRFGNFVRDLNPM